MALQKQPININFAQGLDTKTDPNQVSIGRFLALQDAVFTKAGALTKRNGFELLTTLPDALQTTITTFNESLVATGSNLYSFSADTNQWFNQGLVQPVSLKATSLLKVSTGQSNIDSATAPNNLVCFVYQDSGANYYQISDSITGVQVVGRTALPSTATNPRVFILGPRFIITFIATVSAAPRLQYVAVPTANPLLPTAATDISTDVRTLTSGYDGYVYSGNNLLYLSWEGASGHLNASYMDAFLNVSPPTTIVVTGAHFDLISVTVDSSTPAVWITVWDSAGDEVSTVAFNLQLTSELLGFTGIVFETAVKSLASTAANGIMTLLITLPITVGAPATYPSQLIVKVTVTIGGSMSATSVLLRSVALASKAFLYNGTSYVFVSYGETPNQPTYFLINFAGQVVMRLAYTNGGGYLTTQVLPNITAVGNSLFYAYLTADFLTTVNKGTNLPANTKVNAIYTQKGINLATFSINTSVQYSSNIANDLFLTGGILWEYDGVRPVEQGFNFWPDGVQVTTSASGGSITQHTYFYVFTYEWTDNQGNLNRSAPSIPFQVTTFSGSTSSNTCYIPTLRLTYKLFPNPVRIVGYRWSDAQQAYYQFTSVTNPTLNDPTIDFVTIIDTLADSSILGNALLYTSGGVVEDIVPPATALTTLFNDRMFLVDAEDMNLMWFSKQVIEATPVEFSDLFTIYVAPTIGAQESTGPISALSAMDDKLIIFKKDAIYYITGNGPDNTGANNDFSNPIFITASVGCDNPSSIVLTPEGLMFQSDKGIWLLRRDLNTSYTGAPVEQYNSLPVKSASVIPGTNQVRFVLNNSTTLMYDYYYSQWGTFSNISAISSTLYQGMQTYLNKFGQVFQEAPGTFVDGSIPVLMSFTTSWISAAGLQGYERFYFMYLLGTYFTPFTLNVQLAYDYNTSAVQNILVKPDNFSPSYGGDPLWGDGSGWGGPASPFKARIFPQTQKCETFQVSINEIYDSSLGVMPGQGLTLSGMNMVVGIKKGYRTQSANKSFG